MIIRCYQNTPPLLRYPSPSKIDAIFAVFKAAKFNYSLYSKEIFVAIALKYSLTETLINLYGIKLCLN